MPALPTYLIEPICQQFSALLPEREVDHPLGCHRSRVPDRVVFEKLVQVLVFGYAYERIADEGCSDTTLRRRRDEWIAPSGRWRCCGDRRWRLTIALRWLGAFGGGRGLLHHQGPVRRRESRQEPGR